MAFKKNSSIFEKSNILSQMSTIINCLYYYEEYANKLLIQNRIKEMIKICCRHKLSCKLTKDTK